MNGCSEMSPPYIQGSGCPAHDSHISLCETLDRVLNKGVVVKGEIILSVADVDLVYVGLQLVLTSVATANAMHAPAISGEVTPMEPQDEH